VAKKTKKKPTTVKSAAIVTIHDAPNMSIEGRKRIADWLRQRAKCLTKNADVYSKRFTARYHYLG